MFSTVTLLFKLKLYLPNNIDVRQQLPACYFNCDVLQRDDITQNSTKTFDDDFEESCSLVNIRTSENNTSNVPEDVPTQGSPKCLQQSDRGFYARIRRIVTILQDYQHTCTENESDEDRRREWIFVAKVMDRLFILLFGIGVIVSSITLFVCHP